MKFSKKKNTFPARKRLAWMIRYLSEVFAKDQKIKISFLNNRF